jgi:hypothetical protein
MAYERHYDDSFLDSLHNYLPAILYGAPEQFAGAAPLVSYIQSQVRRRFDLFSAGQRAFAPTMPARERPHAHTHVVFTEEVPIQTPPRAVRIPVRPQRDDALIDLTALLSGGLTTGNRTMVDAYAINLLNTLIQQPQVPAAFMDPVVVHPTAEQIAAGTEIEVVDAQDEMCAICQDSLLAGSEARALNACGHRFHPDCIGTWFQRDVRCPTCRHDVREPAAVPEA